MRSNSAFLTLVVSFCLSAVAYNVAKPVELPVQRLEFEEMIIQPDMEVIEFDDYEIRPRSETVLMDEEVIIAQAQTVPPKEDDNDGANLDMMNRNWCLIHLEDPACQGGDTGGSDDDDEEGC